MRDVSAHAQNDNRSVAAEIFAIGTYFPNTPRIIGVSSALVLAVEANVLKEAFRN
jgi:hypothetical protein